ncbi:RAMP superfamily CRISPR-associated protein [Pseudonocardia oroxyli]|uniref:CRISPR/Cas system CSM-associated protein Csm3, group 7 of RAMP superfamily n=1 Tax=Pseudonocardia oroxyli TaxID=366584 RepID=A0A1G8CR57_PSEOR|nr:RAMP superfamily CRISPR-associated protein [Pseudonocardia oroxyli]SDH47679.1 CRISPR/Cas system CSM-associated protein Csm3, group 7 of RAMP superfamily [Pseudonocardia oroxyli]
MAVTVLRFQITFHGPVRVGRGRAAPGVDDTVDPGVIIPGSSLKGLMRAEATALGLAPTLVDSVFGRGRAQSPWHWGDVVAGSAEVRVGTRIRKDDESGTAVEGGMFAAEFRWPETATFEIRRFDALSDEDLRRHETVLWASALAVHSVGADRNRGFGWVDLQRVDPPSEDLASSVLALAGAMR